MLPDFEKRRLWSSTTYSALFEVRQHLPNQFRATLSQSGSLKRAGPVRIANPPLGQNLESELEGPTRQSMTTPGRNAFEPYPRPARGERRGNARIRAPRFREHCALAALEPLNLPAPAFPGGGLRDRHHNSQGLPGERPKGRAASQGRRGAGEHGRVRVPTRACSCHPAPTLAERSVSVTRKRSWESSFARLMFYRRPAAPTKSPTSSARRDRAKSTVFDAGTISAIRKRAVREIRARRPEPGPVFAHRHIARAYLERRSQGEGGEGIVVRNRWASSSGIRDISSEQVNLSP